MKKHNTGYIGSTFREKDYNFIQAFLICIAAVAILIGLYTLITNRLDNWALSTCEYYQDCEEVIKTLN